MEQFFPTPMRKILIMSRPEIILSHTEMCIHELPYHARSFELNIKFSGSYKNLSPMPVPYLEKKIIMGEILWFYRKSNHWIWINHHLLCYYVKFVKQKKNFLGVWSSESKSETVHYTVIWKYTAAVACWRRSRLKTRCRMRGGGKCTRHSQLRPSREGRPLLFFLFMAQFFYFFILYIITY